MMQLLLVLTTALAGSPVAPSAPMLGAGGPDAYGYRYIDNDTVSPIAPVYNWRSIRDVGTPITGLGDDNAMGPFPIGFDFPFYWYKVNSCYVGSNGYVVFGDRVLEAAPFPQLPNMGRPNNLVAPLMNDLDFSATRASKAFYWTSPGLDSFIVEYDSVPFWNVANYYNTFQVILTKADSAITFQYKKREGNPQGTNDISVGIENITGTIGISYLYGLNPSRNILHDTLAVRFYPPATCTLRVHDVALWRLMNEENGATFVIKDNRVDIMAKVKNTGNQPESAIPVYGFIRNRANSLVFADTLWVPAVAPGELYQIDNFDAWVPPDTGFYRLTVYVNQTPDIFRRNDTMIVQLRSINNTGSGAVLKYGLDTAQVFMAWNGSSGGFGSRFVPPTYPCIVTKASMYMYNASTVGCTLWLFDDNGPGGAPGTVLARTTVNVAARQWYDLNVNPPVRIDSGAFFVGANSGGNQAPQYGQDFVRPCGRQSWEFTGVWAISRDLDSMNVLARATIDSFPLTYVWENSPPPERMVNSLTAYPNPFSGWTVIRFARPLTNPTELKVYDLSGNVVHTLTATGTSATWDGRDHHGSALAHGIYFVRSTERARSMLKIVLTD